MTPVLTRSSRPSPVVRWSRGSRPLRRALLAFVMTLLAGLLLAPSALALSIPTLPLVGEQRPVSIAAGDGHSLAIKTNGTLWAWGLNSSGQLGNGDEEYNSQPSPVPVGEETDWTSVASGASHSLALRGDGCTLWAWGRNDYGQLGNNTTDDSASPIQIGDGTDWLAVDGGIRHSLALKRDGTLWAWGENLYGQLGDGSGSNQLVPKKIGTVDDHHWVAIAAGGFHSLGLKDDGTLWAWGWNQNGQLGVDSTSNLPTPNQVGSDTDWVAISAGYRHTLALKSDGSLWACGDLSDGRLGLGVGLTPPVDTPVEVVGDDWVSAAAGSFHSLGLTLDGSLWGWGDNDDNALGDLAPGDHWAPDPLDWGAAWAVVDAPCATASYPYDANYSLGLTVGGTLYSWGYNVSGLGDGTNTESATPVQVLTGVRVPEVGPPPESVTVTASVSGSGGTVDPASQTIAYRATATIDVIPADGYRLAWATVDGTYLSAPTDPIVLANVTGDRTVEVGFQLDSNEPPLGSGWNLVAGGPDSTPGDTSLFWFDGSGYRSALAVDMVAGRGYWVRSSAGDSMQLATTALPLTIGLVPGWNLIGNSSSYVVAVPDDLTAFVYHDGYHSATFLQPGEAAWIRSESTQTITLSVGD